MKYHEFSYFYALASK